MAKVSEETFNLWRMPPSDHEEGKLAKAEKMVRDAITGNADLNKMSIEVYGQGSYANDTNVRLNSDVDVNVRLTNVFFVELPKGKTNQDYGYLSTNYSFSDYKNTVVNALQNSFGATDVQRLDKCIRIKENSNRSSADVVPTWKYNWHLQNGGLIVGARLISDSSQGILNFSLQHVENGRLKNGRTQKRFKRITRIFKRIKYKMAEDNFYINDHITSFLIECLIYNVPDQILNSHYMWTERVRDIIIFLQNQTADETNCKNWTEVSGLLYLFHSGRKWTIFEVNTFCKTMWNYLEMK